MQPRTTRGSFGLVRGSSVARPVCSGLVRGSSVAHSGSSVARPWVNHGKSVANSGSSGLILHGPAWSGVYWPDLRVLIRG